MIDETEPVADRIVVAFRNDPQGAARARLFRARHGGRLELQPGGTILAVILEDRDAWEVQGLALDRHQAEGYSPSWVAQGEATPPPWGEDLEEGGR